MVKLTFHRLLELYGLNPKFVKLVRHSEREIDDIVNVFRNNRDKFEAYQCFQGKPIYRNAKHIASFATNTGTSALFLGIWDILNFTPKDMLLKKHHDMIDKYCFTGNRFIGDWHNTVSWYDMVYNETLSDLSTRLVIDWGKSTISWVQSIDKTILEIKPVNSVGEFVSYDSVKLYYKDLKQVADNPNSNLTWVSALKSVKGIYLIRDVTDDRIYVGSASGKDGFWGRWKNYASTGHGGNLGLQCSNPHNFVFSILEIVSATFSESDIYKREYSWKEKLGARSDNNLCHN